MMKDIHIRKVRDIAIAAVPSEKEEAFWSFYLVNMKPKTIYDVIVNSKGYGQREGEQKRTSTFRHYFTEIEAMQYMHLELMPESISDLAHEFWLSFRCDDYMYDKKYIFVAGSIDPIHFTEIPLLEQDGVMIR